MNIRKKLVALRLIVVVVLSYFFYEGTCDTLQKIPLNQSIPLETSPKPLNSKDIIDVKDAFRYLVNISKSNINIAGLYFTSGINWKIRHDLKKAIERGVKVNFLFQDSEFARREFDNLKLKRTNVHAKFVNIAELGKNEWGQFHNKYAIFDNKYAILGSANFSYPAFNDNIEISALIVDKKIVNELNRIYQEDFNYVNNTNSYKRLLFSSPNIPNRNDSLYLIETAPYQINRPNVPDIKDTIIDVLKKAKEEILLEVYAFTSNRTNFPLLFSLLKNAANRGVKIKVIINSATFNKIDYVKYAVKELRRNGIEIKEFKIEDLTKPNFSAVHSKLLIVDKKYTLIASSNWTKSGMFENKEIGIFTTQTQFTMPLHKKFFNDWNSRFAVDLK